MNRIFMDTVPAWTNKEVLIAFGSAAAVLMPALISLYRLFSSGLRDRLIAANREVDTLRHQLEMATAKLGTIDSGEFGELLRDARKQVETLQQEKLVAEGDAEAHRSAAGRLTADLEKMSSQFGSEQRRVLRALEADGFTWTEKVRANAPEFRALDDRRMPIISVLNLKGGVGKTTLTANLGAAMSRRGWRVLLIDLDLQGSLTSLFMAEQDQKIAAEERRLIGDFLARSFDAEYPNLLSYTAPIMGSSGSALVGTVDTLAYAEMNLTVRWLLREGNRDPRFILRRELHLKRISNQFDIVLLDCPPLINISCVNALAASDSVLIPVMPSKQATDRVPVLLARMLQFRNNVNSNLKVLGMLANRTRESELTSDEKNRLSVLKETSKNAWGESVPLFESFVRQSTEVRTAEDEHRPHSENDKMAEVFQAVAKELETRLPTFCGPKQNHIPARVEVLQ